MKREVISILAASGKTIQGAIVSRDRGSVCIGLDGDSFAVLKAKRFGEGVEMLIDSTQMVSDEFVS